MAIDTKKLTIKEALTQMESGTLSSVSLTQACIDAINQHNSAYNAILEVYSDALQMAREADERRAKGEKLPLLGVPIVLKDNILFEGHIASASSKMLENYHATYSATVVEKLRAAGAVIIGRANMDEFAMGSSTESSAFGVTKNPYDTERVAGGSSGGSAAAVALGFALAALGTDTAGSIRQPASFCGVVGFKSTYDRVSRYGLIAMGNSLDQAGPIAKTVEDTRIIEEVIDGYDPRDAKSLPPELRKDLGKKIKTIGVPRHLIEQKGMDPEVLARFNDTIELLRNKGYNIVDIELPLSVYSLPVYYIVLPAEVSTNLSRFDGIRYGHHVQGDNLFTTYTRSRAEGFGAETRRRIMLGTFVLSHGYYDSYYKKALALRNMIRGEYVKTFETVDVIATPASPTPAFKIGEKADPLAMYLSDVFTVPANITDTPAVSIPNGFSKAGLPLDIHFTGAHNNDMELLTFAENVEREILSTHATN